MEIKTMLCPRCGAALHITPGSKKTTCEFCRTEFYLDSAGAPHSAEEAGSSGTERPAGVDVDSGQTAGQISGQSFEQTFAQTGENISSKPGLQGAPKRGLAYWALPGFRSGKFSHAVFAVLYYLFMVVGLFAGGPFIETVGMEVFLFGLVIIIYEWQPLTDRIPALVSQKPTTRITAKVLGIIVVLIASGLLMSLS